MLVAKALMREVLMNQARRKNSEVNDLISHCPALLGSSAAMRRAREVALLATRSNARVLVSREGGCLGELVARTLHEIGSASDSPFVTMECDSEDTVTLVSRPSGERDRKVTEPGSTVFLDRLEHMPPAVQVKLAERLRLGQLGDGGDEVRILAGTHGDLKEQVAVGTFRQDLYYYLAVLIVEIPPLRLRPDDIPDLLSRFVWELAVSANRPVPRVPRRTVELCQHYSWPGNLRELRAVVQRLIVSSTRSRLDPSALPDEIKNPRAPEQGKIPFELPPEGLNLEELERHLIRQALERHGGNQTHAARALGMSRQTILYRMRKHGLR